MLDIFVAEVIGTFMLILLGDGVVANVSLNK
jgi:glycerol uptake facilitator-like aquaporin